jgi:cytochrome bd-type quinol oxidase subunit 1
VVHPRVERDAQGNFALDSNGLLKYHLEEGLLTSRAVSEAVNSSQVMSSIVMVAVIYGLLLMIWVTVLYQKIRQGPIPMRPIDHTTVKRG